MADLKQPFEELMSGCSFSVNLNCTVLEVAEDDDFLRPTPPNTSGIIL